MRRATFVLGLVGVLAGGPKLLAAARYLGTLPQGDPAAAAGTVRQVCGSCHGGDGMSTMPTIPNLAGQNYAYLLKQLEDFRSGERKSATMGMIVKTVPVAQHDQNIKNLATYFAGQKPQYRKPGKLLTSTNVLLDGANIYQGGLRVERVPACAACHGVNGLGNAPMAVPALAGQHSAYVLKQLRAFADGKRDNSPHHVMALIADRLSSGQMKAIADYVASLNPALMLGIGPKTYSAYVRSRRTQAVPGVPDPASGSAGTTR